MSFEEKLIEAVRAKPILFDLAHAEYKRVDKKFKVWESVGKEMNVTGETCRKRWKNLRDTYKKRRRQQNLPSGSGAETQGKKKSKFFDLMTFLDDCRDSRPTIDNSFMMPSAFCDYNTEAQDSEQALDGEDSSPKISEITEVREDSLNFGVSAACNSSQSSARRSRRRGADDIERQFASFLEKAERNLNNFSGSGSSGSSATMQFYIAMGKRVEEAALSMHVSLDLELKITELVFQTIGEQTTN